MSNTYSISESKSPFCQHGNREAVRKLFHKLRKPVAWFKDEVSFEEEQLLAGLRPPSNASGQEI